MYLSQLKAKLACVRKVSWKSTSYRISSLIFLASSLFTIKFIISLFINTRPTHNPSITIRINSECVNNRIHIYIYPYTFVQTKKLYYYIEQGKSWELNIKCVYDLYIWADRIRRSERKFKTPRSILMNHDWNREEIYITRSGGIRASDTTIIVIHTRGLQRVCAGSEFKTTDTFV